MALERVKTFTMERRDTMDVFDKVINDWITSQKSHVKGGLRTIIRITPFQIGDTFYKQVLYSISD